jgi:hypothetical protein
MEESAPVFRKPIHCGRARNRRRAAGEQTRTERTHQFALGHAHSWLGTMSTPKTANVP